jgi:hypothetical protein
MKWAKEQSGSATAPSVIGGVGIGGISAVDLQLGIVASGRGPARRDGHARRGQRVVASSGRRGGS